jgi:hypothetical protein
MKLWEIGCLGVDWMGLDEICSLHGGENGGIAGGC